MRLSYRQVNRDNSGSEPRKKSHSPAERTGVGVPRAAAQRHEFVSETQACTPILSCLELTAGLAVGTAMAMALTGCNHLRSQRHTLNAIPPLIQASPDAPDRVRIIDAQKKGVMGRPLSFQQIAHVARDVHPILRDAIEQPGIQAEIREDARVAQMSEDQFKARFVASQEADIVLESGGEANAVSRVGAAGVAQWLASTGRGPGRLRIDEKASARLTAQIDQLERELEHRREMASGAPVDQVGDSESATGPSNPTYQEYSSAGATPAARPHAFAVSASAARSGRTTVSSPAQPPWANLSVPVLKAQIHRLLDERRQIDQRFDPHLALRAQTRYLLKMWRKFPSLDWVFEAYHGGEGSVTRLLAAYMGPAWKRAGSVTNAILGRSTTGKRLSTPLTFEKLFFTTSPKSRYAAFHYLYGLKDEHRLYWFKLEMAAEALDWYRRDRSGLRREWEALRPGYPIEDAWYPFASVSGYADLGSVKEALAKNYLVRPPEISGVQFIRSVEDGAAATPELQSARPEVYDAIGLVNRLYRSESRHPVTLTVISLTQTQKTAKRLMALYPPPPLRYTPEPGVVPASQLPSMHTIGEAASILKPADRTEAGVLEFALHYLEDRERIHFNSESWGTVQAWRITPDPVAKKWLAQPSGILTDH